MTKRNKTLNSLKKNTYVKTLTNDNIQPKRKHTWCDVTRWEKKNQKNQEVKKLKQIFQLKEKNEKRNQG